VIISIDEQKTEKLFDRVRETIRLKKYSDKTEQITRYPETMNSRA
jgi:hypothetical protein